jgi:hypothetical protein
VFDWRHGISTCGNAKLTGLTIVGDNASQGVFYHPSHPKFLFEAVGALQIDFEKHTFVDLGSGKGRVILVASEFPFREVVGVEFARELHEVACENVRSYRSASQKCKAVRTLHADASDFEFPTTPLVLFLFNPFGRSVFRTVLHNLQRSIDKHPREVIVMYAAPFHGDLIEQETVLRCTERGAYHTTYRTPAV